MFDLKQDLCKFLNENRLHLAYDDVKMSELNGIGSIYIAEIALRDMVLDFLVSNGVKAYLQPCVAYRDIRFYSDEYADEIENIGDNPLDWEWQIVAKRVCNEFLMEKYNVLGFENDYWFSLEPNAVKAVIVQRFRTFGSNISGDRRVEIVETIRELDEYELKSVIKPDLELMNAEKELYFWYMSRERDNFSAILYTLIAKADGTNREKLRKGYPKEVEVMGKFQNEENYWGELKDRVEESLKGN